MEKQRHPLVAYLKAEKLSVVWLAKHVGISRVTLAAQIKAGAPMRSRLAIETATRGGFPVTAWPDYMGADARHAYSNIAKARGVTE